MRSMRPRSPIVRPSTDHRRIGPVFANLDVLDPPSLGGPPGLPAGKGIQTPAELLDLDQHRRERIADELPPHQPVERRAELGGNLRGIGRGRGGPGAERLEDLVGQRAEGHAVHLLGIVAHGAKPQPMPQVIAVGTGQVIAELRHPHRRDRLRQRTRLGNREGRRRR